MKIAIVTGASTDLGKDFVYEISKHFSGVEQIWIVDNKADSLEYLKKFVHSKKLVTVKMDLTLDESYLNFKKLLKKYRPRIKILINCASIGKISNFDKSQYAEQIDMVNLNCKSTIAITKIAIPYMYSGSCIINISSIAAFIPLPKLAVYSATKSMILSFTRALRAELKPKGIHVTAICSGILSSEFEALSSGKKENWAFDKLPLANHQKVVANAMKAAIKNKELSIHGILFKPLVIAAKIIPHGLFLKLFK